MNKLAIALTALLLSTAACQPKKAAEADQITEPDTRSTTLAVPAPPADRTAEYLADPKVGDVLVVRFVPEGETKEQFYFYQVFRLSGDTVVTHPAQKPAASADADVQGMGVFAQQAERAYTKQELLDYQKEDPADPQHSRLVRVIRR